ncbi:unnamed protein product [Mytilus coruscus]|uniref:Fibrinogen C-terminal domain-containing protein n=1 Tax=Mytilus coruscus TaxID=42192 RepID=A0A6J8B331_MYTCO|nr:unnamed protein product [Mytilus coruscus]
MKGHVASVRLMCTKEKSHFYLWLSSSYLPNDEFLVNHRICHAFYSSGLLPVHYTRFVNGAEDVDDLTADLKKKFSLVDSVKLQDDDADSISPPAAKKLKTDDFFSFLPRGAPKRKRHIHAFSVRFSGDGLSNGNRMKFSTKDLDNDISTSHCAVDRHADWWLRDCDYENLSGRYDSQNAGNYWCP